MKTDIAEQIIVDILMEEMNLPNSRVFITNQNINIPNNDELYIIVGMVDSQVMSNTKSVVAVDASTTEIRQQVQMRDNIQVDILSSGSTALLRKHEVLMALNSVYAEQKQEENEFRIFEVPTTFVNSSSAEGGSQINRFSIVVPCFVWYRKDTAIENIDGDYYDDFDTRVDDKNTIEQAEGLIEFNIS